MMMINIIIRSNPNIHNTAMTTQLSSVSSPNKENPKSVDSDTGRAVMTTIKNVSLLIYFSIFLPVSLTL